MLTILDGRRSSSVTTSATSAWAPRACSPTTPECSTPPAAARRREPAADVSPSTTSAPRIPAQLTHAPDSADTLSVGRERFVGTSVTEHLTLSNESMAELSFDVDLELGADFADIISVKAHDLRSAIPSPRRRYPSTGSARRSRARRSRSRMTRVTARPFASHRRRTHRGRGPLLRLAPCPRQVGADLRRQLRPGRRVGAALTRPDLRHRAAARA